MLVVVVGEEVVMVEEVCELFLVCVGMVVCILCGWVVIVLVWMYLGMMLLVGVS